MMLNQTSKLAALVAVIAIVTVALGCGPNSDSDKSSDDSGPLTIGVINPFSGDFAFYGEELFRGDKLAVDEINAKGGIDGRKVKLVKGDAATPEQGTSQAQRLIDKEGVDVLTGTYISAVSEAASDTAARQDKLYWETNGLAENLTERGLKNYIRVGPDANAFAEVSVEALQPVAEKLGKKLSDLTVRIEHEDSIYGTTIGQRQESLIKEQGGKVVGNGSHDATATDVTDSVLRAKSVDPDVWMLTGYVPDTNLLLRTARDQGFSPDAVITAGTGDTKETLEALGPRGVEGLLVASYPRPDLNPDYGPGAAKFLASYRHRYGSDPRAPQSMTAYAGLKVLFDALEKDGGKTAPADVRKAAEAIDEPVKTLATGYGVKFDDKFQNTRAKPTVIQWQHGKQVTVYPEDAAKAGNRITGLPRR
jgi:branched-chain amino acid transport system substrate-binding protein